MSAMHTYPAIDYAWCRYQRKGVPEGKAIILSAADNFHGRTLGVIRCELLFVTGNFSSNLVAA